MPRAKADRRPTALYRARDAHGHLLYVGVSVSLMNRLNQHSGETQWERRVRSIGVAWYPNRQKALQAEREAIRVERPLLNFIHNDRVHGELRRRFVLHPEFVAETRAAPITGPELMQGADYPDDEVELGEIESAFWRWFPDALSAREVHENLEPPFRWVLSPLDVYEALTNAPQFVEATTRQYPQLQPCGSLRT